jgi:hypothetical protein
VRQQEDGEGHQRLQRADGAERAAGAALRVLRIEGLLPDGLSPAGPGEQTVNESMLKKCNACGGQISRHSPFCRHCGHPQPLPLFFWLVVIFFLMMMAFYLSVTIYGALHAERFQVGLLAPGALWPALLA